MTRKSRLSDKDTGLRSSMVGSGLGSLLAGHGPALGECAELIVQRRELTAAERQERVEIYVAQVEAAGKLDFGAALREVERRDLLRQQGKRIEAMPLKNAMADWQSDNWLNVDADARPAQRALGGRKKEHKSHCICGYCRKKVRLIDGVACGHRPKEHKGAPLLPNSIFCAGSGQVPPPGNILDRTAAKRAREKQHNQEEQRESA